VIVSKEIEMNGEKKNVKRSYSISSDSEVKNYIELTIKQTGLMSSYICSRMALGDTLDFEGPYGKFILPVAATEINFIAGGAGIAPLMSMIRHLAVSSTKSHLLYSSVSEEEIIFYKEICSIKNLKSAFTLTQKSSGGPGLAGRIRVEMMKAFFPNLDAEFYVCGPPEMVRDVIKMLEDLKVKKIHKESW
jgi:benzoate/toluate 1,2-dioxygenase reductase subunit